MKKDNLMMEEINLLFTDNELKMIANLIQILLYLINLILDTDETLGFLEQAEADLLTKIENMLKNRFRGKQNYYEILKHKPLEPDNALTNGVSQSSFHYKHSKKSYEMNL